VCLSGGKHDGSDKNRFAFSGVRWRALA